MKFVLKFASDVPYFLVTKSNDTEEWSKDINRAMLFVEPRISFANKFSSLATKALFVSFAD